MQKSNCLQDPGYVKSVEACCMLHVACNVAWIDLIIQCMLKELKELKIHVLSVF